MANSIYPTDDDLRGLRATVMGLGEFGGGIGAIRFLAERGAHVTVTDLRSEAELRGSLEKLDHNWQLTLRLGQHEEADFRETDLVVVNPAVPKTSRFIDVARRAGVPLTSEMNLFWTRNLGRVIAVTGSNGKSTTTSLIHAILEQDSLRTSQKCWLGGNIGVSLLPDVDHIAPVDWVVLELSSFQLEDLAPLRPAPEISVVTNFSPNHLDRHGTIEAYRAAKQQLLKWQSASDFTVVNAISEVASWPTAATRLRFGDADERRQGIFGSSHEVIVRLPSDFGEERRLPLSEWLRLPGIHNWQNAQAAIAATLVAGVSIDSIERAVSNFRGLPHRLEFVAEVAGRRCFNDSKSTTPEATVLALEAFQQPIVLLAGGYDKQIDLTSIAAAAVTRCRAVALLGQTGPELGRLIEQAALALNITAPKTRSFESLEPAVAWSLQESAGGDIVLLSPGCASYDWFKNYIERGEQFSSFVTSRTL